MKEAGFFGMAMPHKWSGAELGPLTQVRIIEALAMANGSVDWCAMINCDSSYTTAFLDLDVGRAINVATGASATPSGTVVRVNGGYCVSGPVSGIDHCDWIFMGCIFVEDGAPRLDENGVPETRRLCPSQPLTRYLRKQPDGNRCSILF
jgi:Acyl-CoA dehydrogenase, N-terminal domain